MVKRKWTDKTQITAINEKAKVTQSSPFLIELTNQNWKITSNRRLKNKRSANDWKNRGKITIIRRILKAAEIKIKTISEATIDWI